MYSYEIPIKYRLKPQAFIDKMNMLIHKCDGYSEDMEVSLYGRTGYCLKIGGVEMFDFDANCVLSQAAKLLSDEKISI